MKIRKIALLAISAAFMFTSCSSDDDTTIVEPLGDYENGILLIHEGNFAQGNAMVSFVSNDLTTMESTIFTNVNGDLLGDTAQSIGFYNDLAYMVIHNSQKIEVVNRYTFESVATITTGLMNPRFIAFANGKGYVTNWGDATNATDDFIAVVNLETNAIESSIAVVEGPEEIVTTNNSVYVAHKGGYNQNNKVSVIDATSNTLTTTITVGDVPHSLQLDTSNNLWVLSEGVPSWTGSETAGNLLKINTSTNAVSFSVDFATTEHPKYLSVENGNLYYYMDGAVYKMADTDAALPTTSELSGVNFHNMEVHNGILYGADAIDFTSNGTLTSFDMSTNTQINSITVGVIPRGIYFN